MGESEGRVGGGGEEEREEELILLLLLEWIRLCSRA